MAQNMQDLVDELKKLHGLVNEFEAKNKERNEVKDKVIALIKAKGLEDKQFDIGNRMIRYKVSTTTGSITNAYLHEALDAYHKEDRDAASRVYKYIVENRPKTEREGLEILKKKNA